MVLQNLEKLLSQQSCPDRVANETKTATNGRRTVNGCANLCQPWVRQELLQRCDPGTVFDLLLL